MQTRLITTTGEFSELQSAWNELADKCFAETFALWDWAFSSHETLHCGDTELFIIVIEEGRKPVAIAPLCIRPAGLGPLRGRAVRFIGDEHADYGSFLLDPAHNEHDLLKRLFAVLFEHRERWDILHLLNCSSRNPQTHLLAEIAASEFGATTAFGERVLTPYFHYDENTPRLITKEARNLRRRERNLERDYQVEIEIGAAFDEESWNAFLECHFAKWPDSIFRQEKNLRFFRALIPRLEQSGHLELSLLRLDGSIAAMHLGFRTPRKIFYYIPVYREESARDGVGGILLKHIIEHYAGTVNEFDFLRGNEPYKFFWTGHVGVNEDLIIDNGLPHGRLLRGSMTLRNALRRIAWLKKLYDTINGVLRPARAPSPASIPPQESRPACPPATRTEEPVAG